MHELLEHLTHGDRRSVRGVAEVVQAVLVEPRLFRVVFDAMSGPDALLRMRAADAVEKITRRHPEYLGPLRGRVLVLAARARQQEVQWHLAQLLSRVRLNARERRRAAEILRRYLCVESRIVRTFAMQTLADLAERDMTLRPAIVPQLQVLSRSGSPAMRSRGRKLLARLQKGR